MGKSLEFNRLEENDVPAVTNIIQEGGLLSKRLEGYRPRPGQLALAEAVEKSIAGGHHLLAEAATGTGKSMGYGLPAALHAVTNNETVVIATANITLQEQLIGKDLPLIAELVSEVTGKELNFRLIKGMGNYLCLDKLSEATSDEEWYEDITEWADKTDTGDKNELDVEYPPAVWSKLSTTSEDCLRKKCRFIEECFVYKAREEEDLTHIIVTNYHMLFTDLTVKEATEGHAGVIPPYDVLIMDEAHEAKDIAMAFQGFEFTGNKLRWLVNRLRATKIEGASARADRLLNLSEFFFNNLRDFEDKRTRDMIIREPLGWDEGLVESLKNTSDFLRNHAKSERPKNEDAKAALARIGKLGEVFLKRSMELESVCVGYGDPPTLPYGMVFYVEKRQRGDVSLCCKGVEVQQFLRDNLFDKMTVIGTSATLTTNGHFMFIASELGLEQGEYGALIAPSPFDPTRMLVIIPSSMPDPRDREAHMQATAEAVCYLKETLGGQIMALFTSYKAMNNAAQLLRQKYPESYVFVQGENPKSLLIEWFKSNKSAVLLATSSFWQGVDIPGKALSCLVIDKFPFLPPTDPVLKYMEGRPGSDGMSAFFDYSVPKAVIAMKQGVGRLIRTETDSGVVVLCDNRLTTKNYGAQFERALPYGHYRSSNLSDAKAFLDEMSDSLT
jgi:ATP-dependent DNA helicase DinG